jgi:hypothetical protein
MVAEADVYLGRGDGGKQTREDWKKEDLWEL